MKEQHTLNPFLVSGYSPHLFCDRKRETALLIRNATNGVNTTLLSVRRMGKTGVLHHTLHQLAQKKIGTGIYADIFDTEDTRGFVNRMATSVMQAAAPGHPFLKKITEFIKGLRPVISYDEITGQPQVMLDYTQPKQYEYSLQDILLFLEKQNKLTVIAIDEFQQISRYPEKNIESVLRTYIQPLKNVRFIFSGSSPHLLTQIFHRANRPFFSSAQSIELTEIGSDEYSMFISTQFKKYGQLIEKRALEFILDFTKRHTYYTQSLCNFLFSDKEKNISLHHAQATAYQLLKQNEPVYYQYRTMLTRNQWAMLKAIAAEGNMYQPTSGRIVSKYRLGSGSSAVIQRSLQSLLTKEMIYTKEDANGKYYRVYDCFFSRWLEQHYA